MHTFTDMHTFPRFHTFPVTYILDNPKQLNGNCVILLSTITHHGFSHSGSHFQLVLTHPLCPPFYPLRTVHTAGVA